MCNRVGTVLGREVETAANAAYHARTAMGASALQRGSQSMVGGGKGSGRTREHSR